jgi:hypothetical protein
MIDYCVHRGGGDFSVGIRAVIAESMVNYSVDTNAQSDADPTAKHRTMKGLTPVTVPLIADASTT